MAVLLRLDRDGKRPVENADMTLVFTCSSAGAEYMRRFPLPHGDFQTARQLVFELGRKAYWGSLELHNHPDAKAVVRALAPDEPVICNRPHAAARAARFFAEKFPGKTLYAVKANPSPELLQILWDSGITQFDLASIAEVRLVRGVRAASSARPVAARGFVL